MRLELFASALLVLGAISIAGCGPAPPGTLKTIELTPRGHFTSNHFFGGQRGLCLGGATPGRSAFMAGSDQVMVGFDNVHFAGSFCDALRAQTFRGLVDFDVSQFDSIVSANLIFDTQKSAERLNLQTPTVGRNPPKSFANTLGLAIPPITNRLDYDTDAPLGPGPSFNVAVTSQVKSWLDGSHSTSGFVLAGPLGLPDRSNFRENNEAQVSWYGNFKLRIVYNPAANPRAPQ